MTPVDAAAPFRIAVRQEGDWINAYFAKRGNLDEAVLLATMRASVGQMDGAHAAFLKFCEALAHVVIDDAMGPGFVRGTTLEQAPEHERPGHG